MKPKKSLIHRKHREKMRIIMAKLLGPKQIATVQTLAISDIREIEALRQLLFEKGIIPEDLVEQDS